VALAPEKPQQVQQPPLTFVCAGGPHISRSVLAQGYGIRNPEWERGQWQEMDQEPESR